MRIFPLLALLLALPLQAAPVPEPPELKADSYALMDFHSGQFLAEYNADAKLEPASIAKVMLIYIAFDELKKGRIKEDDQVLVSEKAWRRGYATNESRMFIEVGKRVRVIDLLRGIVVQSGNDASVALAEHIAGSEDLFVDLMNQYATRLGLTNTRYANATGVPDPDMYTTARDVALLSRALIRDFPELYKMFGEKEFTYNKIRQPNRNLLLWRDPSVDGIKTGHTEAAGYGLAASAERDGRRLISVVLGMKSMEARAQGTMTLLNYGFRFFDTHEFAPANQPISTVRVWKGAAKEVALGLQKPLILSVPRNSKDRVKVEPVVAEQPFAPVTAGQPLGMLRVTLGGETLHSEPLVALQDVPRGSLWQRLIDEIRLWISQRF